MNRSKCLVYISYVIDTALSLDQKLDKDTATLVGWQLGFEPMFVAVQDAYTDESGCRDIVQENEAVEIAMDYLKEINWFDGEPIEPDYVIKGGEI